MLTASGSGVRDPYITPADAALQVARLAKARCLRIAEVEALLRRDITCRDLGIFGEERVDVPELNLA